MTSLLVHTQRLFCKAYDHKQPLPRRFPTQSRTSHSTPSLWKCAQCGPSKARESVCEGSLPHCPLSAKLNPLGRAHPDASQWFHAFVNSHSCHLMVWRQYLALDAVHHLRLAAFRNNPIHWGPESSTMGVIAGVLIRKAQAPRVTLGKWWSVLCMTLLMESWNPSTLFLQQVVASYLRKSSSRVCVMAKSK